ncbi:MAG: transposase [Verrucomicrobia bacterium]|nr:transposase [Verrucomicrobiota bacterium]
MNQQLQHSGVGEGFIPSRSAGRDGVGEGFTPSRAADGFTPSRDGLPVRKPLRLPIDSYAKPNRWYFITLCTKQKQHLFDTPAIRDTLVDALHGAVLAECAEMAVYVIMPDHVHWISDCGKSDITRQVRRFKGIASQMLRNRHDLRNVWQRSFFDHVVRSDESLQEKCEYVRQNPARRGLVSQAEDYRWFGSIHLEDVGDVPPWRDHPAPKGGKKTISSAGWDKRPGSLLPYPLPLPCTANADGTGGDKRPGSLLPYPLPLPCTANATMPIPDNSEAPRFPDLRSYFTHRRRIERMAMFYGKRKIQVNDEQGLPNIRRETLAGVT